DEPHADAQRYRRLHVIVGDANLAEVATFLKVGTTSFVLAMIEDDTLPWDFRLADPVQALQQVSTDLTLARPLELADGSTITALEIQWELLDRSRKYAETEGTDAVGGESVAADVLDRWEQVLGGLEHDVDTVAGQVDWVAKKRLLDGFAERHDLDDPGDPRLAALALQYHDLRPDRSLAARAGLERITTDEEVERAVTEPPDDTRAYFRGRCLSRFGEHIVAANWDSMVFDLGDEPLRRVPMMEPGRGGRAQVGTLLEESNDLSELVERLGA
ncbi:MAG: proteasome accessory factor PafA2 family protein, partial [Actinomycetota bacterium]